ncbi:MAG: hypothetical protein AAGK14_11830, partial [Verrucomicrobiota bacterium]
MKFAKHWALAVGTSPLLRAHGWSDENMEAAQVMAGERLAKLEEQAKAGTLPSAPSSVYYHVERPPREELIEEIPAAEGDAAAGIVSRNCYGSLVLNTAGFAMVDIDCDVSPGVFDFFKTLFGGKGAKQQAEESLRRKVDEWMLLSKRNGRLYRTAGGYRLLLTDRPEDPASDAFQRSMDDLGADPLFRQLCRGQESFRARLTPKPWRMGLANPPDRYPWDTPVKES